MELMYNPAFAGVEGAASLRVSAFSFMPGKGYGLSSAYASCDAYIDALHGGAGVWIADDHLGEIMNDFRAGAGYAYHFRAGRRLYITGGLTASVISRGIRSGAVILPGDIDPFRGGAGGPSMYMPQEPVTRFDLGTGITAAAGPWYAGVSVMHLTRPALDKDNRSGAAIERLYTVMGGVRVPLPGDQVFLNPSAVLQLQGGEMRVCLAGEASWRSLSASFFAWHVTKGFTAAGASAGWGTEAVRISISYSYIVSGGDALFAGTAIVRAGLLFTLSNVEKSRVPHIIKLPLL